MAGKRSAGLLLFRGSGAGPEVLLAHMGGPLWARRDAGAWSVPKGEYVPPEEPLAAARREFEEELGLPAPDGPYLPLGDTRQAGGKTVTVWAVAGDLDPARIVPGTFRMEWPRGSGAVRSFPEIDRVAWYAPDQARPRLVTGQRVFLDRLAARLRAAGGPGPGTSADRTGDAPADGA
ncbi:NUDIX domain-containing protein [Streptomyces celluloflavus]|uniref:NUDIX domain-containing protein n=1 Tax=Streptomyces celluloflavus TaxID=58344 RepID=UPI00365E0070